MPRLSDSPARKLFPQGVEEEVGVLLLQEWVKQARDSIARFGPEAIANMRTVFGEVNKLAADWLSSRSESELQSLFFVSLRILGFEIQSWRTEVIDRSTVVSVHAKRKQIEGLTTQTVVLRPRNTSVEDQGPDLVWTHLTEQGDMNTNISTLSLQRVLMAMATFIFIGFFEQQRDFLQELESVSAPLSFDYAARATIMVNWNSIQRSVNGHFQI